MRLFFGIGGVSLDPGDHICALHYGRAERWEQLASYVSAGLTAGHKCLCLLTPTDHFALPAALGYDSRRYIATEQLVLGWPSGAHVTNRTLPVSEPTPSWTETVEMALDEGYTHVRLAIDVSRVIGHRPSSERLSAYESALDRIAAGLPVSVLCLWDMSREGNAVEGQLLRTHRRLILGGSALDSPYFEQRPERDSPPVEGPSTTLPATGDPMIGYVDVVPLLTAACPTFLEFANFPGVDSRNEGHLILQHLAAHVIRLLGEGRTESFAAVADTVEWILLDGDADAQALVIDGFLRALHEPESHRGSQRRPAEFRPWLGEQARSLGRFDPDLRSTDRRSLPVESARADGPAMDQTR